MLLRTLFEFADHGGKAGFLSGGGVSVHYLLGTRLIQCLDRLAKQLFGIFHTPRTNRLDDVLATVTNERPSGTVAFAGGDVLAKPFFGTGNVWHNFLRNLLLLLAGDSTPFFAKDKGGSIFFRAIIVQYRQSIFTILFKETLCYAKPLFRSFAF